MVFGSPKLLLRLALVLPLAIAACQGTPTEAGVYGVVYFCRNATASSVDVTISLANGDSHHTVQPIMLRNNQTSTAVPFEALFPASDNKQTVTIKADLNGTDADPKQFNTTFSTTANLMPGAVTRADLFLLGPTSATSRDSFEHACEGP